MSKNKNLSIAQEYLVRGERRNDSVTLQEILDLVDGVNEVDLLKGSSVYSLERLDEVMDSLERVTEEFSVLASLMLTMVRDSAMKGTLKSVISDLDANVLGSLVFDDDKITVDNLIKYLGASDIKDSSILFNKSKEQASIPHHLGKILSSIKRSQTALSSAGAYSTETSESFDVFIKNTEEFLVSKELDDKTGCRGRMLYFDKSTANGEGKIEREVN